MTESRLDRDLYLELLDECFDAVREMTVEGVSEIAEYDVEKRCDEAVGKHEIIGNIDEPRTNAAILAVALRTESMIEDSTPNSAHQSAAKCFAELAPAEYLADLAHRAAKYDLITRVLDEQAEAERQ
jgi:hypothetical protein